MINLRASLQDAPKTPGEKMRETSNTTEKKQPIREPASALTHFIALLLTLFAGIPMLYKASFDGGLSVFSILIFLGSMILLYAASTTYHAINISEAVIRRFRKLDHSMVFILIAGSYTPVCILILEHRIGYLLLASIWTLALAGIIMKLVWITSPKWVTAAVYIAMGWLAILAVRPIFRSLPHAGFLWLLFGGIVYTIGGIIYALKLPLFDARHQIFGTHEIFHLFVMGGSFCHFVFMYQYVI